MTDVTVPKAVKVRTRPAKKAADTPTQVHEGIRHLQDRPEDHQVDPHRLRLTASLGAGVLDHVDVGRQAGRTGNTQSELTHAQLAERCPTGRRGANVGVGGAVQQFKLDGQYSFDQTLPVRQTINRTFTTFIPNVSLNFDLKNNKYMYGGCNSREVGICTRRL